MMLSRLNLKSLVLAVVVLSAGSVFAQTTLKIGVFDPNRVSAEAADAIRAQTLLQQTRDIKQQEIAQRESAIQALQQQLQQQALSLSSERRLSLELNIQRQVLEVNAEKELATRQLQLELAAAEARFNEQLRTVLSEFAKSESFDLILDTGAVAYISESIDVTTALIDQFNRLYPVDGE